MTNETTAADLEGTGYENGSQISDVPTDTDEIGAVDPSTESLEIEPQPGDTPLPEEQEPAGGQIFYSATTRGFYRPEIHGNAIPEDKVLIPGGEQELMALLAGEASGQMIVPDNEGYPTLVDRPPPTEAEIQAMKVAVVQRHLDQAATLLGYDSIANAITYADEPAVPKFQAEGRAFRAWRSLVWDTCYRILDQVKAGEREIPTDDELLAELPELSLSADL